MQERINIHRPDAGSPIPKNPKRSTHANIDMSITPLMPKRLRQNGMRSMQQVSLIWEREIRALAFCAAQASA